MRQENVQYFTDREEEFVNLLIDTGTKKNIAKVLVFLAGFPEGATSHEIERRTDLRQPEISTAIRFMRDLGWIESRANPSTGKGRPQKVCSLAKPFGKIVDAIEREKRAGISTQMAIMGKLRHFQK
jgi:predicted transcriptional regulator